MFRNELQIDVEKWKLNWQRTQESMIYTNRLLIYGHPTELSIIIDNKEKMLKMINDDDRMPLKFRKDFNDWLSDNIKGYFNIWISGIDHKDHNPRIISFDTWTIDKELHLDLINNIRIDFCQKRDAVLFKLKY